MQLAEGASLLREDLPPSARREVAVPLEAGDAMGTPIARLSSVLSARDAAREHLAEITEVPIIVGGDCATTLPGLEAAVRRHGAESLAILWFDAHPDFQHPSTSPSGSASGMTLRHALGDGSPDLATEHPADATRITLVGTRANDPEEDAELDRLGIPTLHPDLDGDDFAATIADRLQRIDATHVYVHIDLDVLDPSEFSAVHAPVPFGLSVAQLIDAVRSAVSTLELAGASICEFAPADDHMAAEDLPTILRLLGALTSNGRA